METRTAILLLGAGLWLAAGGCATDRQPNASAVPPPLPPGGGTSLLADEQVMAARELFIDKCTSCHKFHPPANYSGLEWDSWMRKMSRKARLKPTEEGTLREYLSLFRR